MLHGNELQYITLIATIATIIAILMIIEERGLHAFLQRLPLDLAFDAHGHVL